MLMVKKVYSISSNEKKLPNLKILLDDYGFSQGVLNKLCQTAFLVRLNFQSARKENIKLRDS